MPSPFSPCITPWPQCRTPRTLAELDHTYLDPTVSVRRIVLILLAFATILAVLAGPNPPPATEVVPLRSPQPQADRVAS
jgi:hypothetical protein